MNDGSLKHKKPPEKWGSSDGFKPIHKS